MRLLRAGVGVTRTVTGTSTTLRRGAVSPKPGGDITVNVTVPEAGPERPRPDALTRIYSAR
jgi:hypothetical protein